MRSDHFLHTPRRSALILYRQILDSIEKNDYDNFTKRAYVSKGKKLLSLPQVPYVQRSHQLPCVAFLCLAR